MTKRILLSPSPPTLIAPEDHHHDDNDAPELLYSRDSKRRKTSSRFAVLTSAATIIPADDEEEACENSSPLHCLSRMAILKRVALQHSLQQQERPLQTSTFNHSHQPRPLPPPPRLPTGLLGKKTLQLAPLTTNMNNNKSTDRRPKMQDDSC